MTVYLDSDRYRVENRWFRGCKILQKSTGAIHFPTRLMAAKVFHTAEVLRRAGHGHIQNPLAFAELMTRFADATCRTPDATETIRFLAWHHEDMARDCIHRAEIQRIHREARDELPTLF